MELPTTAKALFYRLHVLAERIDKLKEQYRSRDTKGLTADISGTWIDRTGTTKRTAEDAATLAEQIQEAQAEHAQVLNICLKLVFAIEDLTTGTLAFDVLINQTRLETAGAKLNIRSRAEKQRRLDAAFEIMEVIYRETYFEERETNYDTKNRHF